MSSWDNESARSTDVGQTADQGVQETQGDATAQRRVDVAMRRRWIARKAKGAAASNVNIPEGGGAPLGGKVQKGMEKHLGADLSAVRVHTGGESADAASNLGARAFTVGTDVHFNKGEFSPGSVEGDRLLAHELTHVVQGQKTGIQRKAKSDEAKSDEGGASEAHAEGAEGEEKDGAGGDKVSQPGEPAEQEADAMGDHVADKEHGGGGKDEKKDKKDKKDNKDKKDKKKGAEAKGDHGAGEHDHGDEGGKDGAEAGGAEAGGAEAGGKAEAGDEKSAGKEAAPPIAAKLEGVGRKIFLAKAPGAAAAPAAGAGAGAGGKAAPAKSADEVKAEKSAKDAMTAITVEANNKDLPSRLKHWGDQMQPLTTKFPENQALKDVGLAMKTKTTEVMTLCTATMTTAAGKIDKLAKAPESWAAEGAIWGDSENLRWMMAYPDNGAVVAFKQSHEKKQTELKAERDRVCKDAKGKLSSVAVSVDPAKPGDDPRAHVDQAFEAARPWMGKNIPDITSEQALQQAYVDKIEAISTAKAKAAQEAAAKEKEKEKEKAAPGAGAKPAEAHGAAPAAHAPPPAPAHEAPAHTPPAHAPEGAHGDAPHGAHAAEAPKTATPVGPATPVGAPVVDPAKAKEEEELKAKKEELKTRLMMQQGKTNAALGAAGTSISLLGAFGLTLATGGLPGVLVACGLKLSIGVTKFMQQKDTKVLVAEIDKIETIHELELMLSIAKETSDEIKTFKILLEAHLKERKEQEQLDKDMGKAAPAAPAGAAKARGTDKPPTMGQKAMHAGGKAVSVGEKVEAGGDIAATGMETTVHAGGEALKEGAKHFMEHAVPMIEVAGSVFSVLATGFEILEYTHLAHEHHEAAEKLELIEKAKLAASGAPAAPAAAAPKA